MKTLYVNIPGAEYPIHIGAGILDECLPDVVRGIAREQVLIVTNETLARLYPQRLQGALAGLGLRLDTCVLPDGERFKTPEMLGRIYDRLLAGGANRGTLLLAFGGGVVGDMTGFAAATFMRGIPYIQVPTTLLAHVDSSVGGKTAVNHPLGKNAIGAFKQPRAVVIDLEFLRTLPQRERHAGALELIKHGIIRDPALFAFLEARRAKLEGNDWAFWSEAVYRSCAVKAAVVEADEREQHLRAILNFGHSLAHLIETHTGYETVLHGEAVGAGMLFAAHVSRRWEHIDEATFERIRALLAPLLRVIDLPPLSEARFAELLMHDKKAAAGGLNFILLRALGEAFIRPGTTPRELWPLFAAFPRDVPGVLRLAAA